MLQSLLLALAAALAPTPAQKVGLPPVKPGPVPGYVMIADRNNNRIIMVSPSKKIVWEKDGLHDPDDAFFTPGVQVAISTNEEYNQTMALIGIRVAPRRVVVRARRRARVIARLHVESGRRIPAAEWGSCRWPTSRTAASSEGEPRASDRAQRSVTQATARTQSAEDAQLAERRHAAPRRWRARPEIGGWVDLHQRDRQAACTPCARRRRTRRTRNCCRTATSSSRGSTCPGRVDEITPSGKIRCGPGSADGGGVDAEPALPRHPLAERDDRAHRRLEPPRDSSWNPRTKKVRVVVRPPRQSRNRTRLPEQARRPRPAPGAVPGGVKAARERRLVQVSRRSARCRRCCRRHPRSRSRAESCSCSAAETGGSSTDGILAGTPQRLRGCRSSAGADARCSGGADRRSVSSSSAAVRRCRRTRSCASMRRSGHAQAAGTLDEPALGPRCGGRGRQGGYLVGGYTGATVRERGPALRRRRPDVNGGAPARGDALRRRRCPRRDDRRRRWPDNPPARPSAVYSRRPAYAHRPARGRPARARGACGGMAALGGALYLYQRRSVSASSTARSRSPPACPSRWPTPPSSLSAGVSSSSVAVPPPSTPLRPARLTPCAGSSSS